MPDTPHQPDTTDATPDERRRLGRVGFDQNPDAYERARPGYPDDAVDALVATACLRPGARVLDVAAGTGKLTRQLAARRLACLALEPSAAMRSRFRMAVVGVPVLGGVAEALPLADGVVDAAVVAQAFHWLDPPVALPEIVRVLRPGGWLAVIRNERDGTDPVVTELVRRSRWDRHAPSGVMRDFGADLECSELFGPVRRSQFHFVQHLDLDTFVDQVASRSYVQVLDPRRRQEVLGSVRDLGASLGEPIRLPYTTDLWCAPVAG